MALPIALLLGLADTVVGIIKKKKKPAVKDLEKVAAVVERAQAMKSGLSTSEGRLTLGGQAALAAILLYPSTPIELKITVAICMTVWQGLYVWSRTSVKNKPSK